MGKKLNRTGGLESEVLFAVLKLVFTGVCAYKYKTNICDSAHKPSNLGATQSQCIDVDVSKLYTSCSFNVSVVSVISVML